jgi:hypothetical protein
MSVGTAVLYVIALPNNIHVDLLVAGNERGFR